ARRRDMQGARGAGVALGQHPTRLAPARGDQHHSDARVRGLSLNAVRKGGDLSNGFGFLSGWGRAPHRSADAPRQDDSFATVDLFPENLAAEMRRISGTDRRFARYAPMAKRALVVEDDLLNRMLYCAVLEGRDFTVEAVGDG